MTHIVPEKASFFAKTQKAFAGGIAGAVTAAGTTVVAALADGSVNQGEFWLIAGAVVGGFVVGFASVYAAPANV